MLFSLVTKERLALFALLVCVIFGWIWVTVHDLPLCLSFEFSLTSAVAAAEVLESYSLCVFSPLPCALPIFVLLLSKNPV